jgi:hypothetical protein
MTHFVYTTQANMLHHNSTEASNVMYLSYIG